MFTAVFSGRLGSDVEFRYTGKGEPMAAFSIAISTGAENPPLWVDVAVFGKAAETFAKLEPHKGDFCNVRVTRVPEVRTWESKKGGVGAGLRVVADWIEIAHRAMGTATGK